MDLAALCVAKCGGRLGALCAWDDIYFAPVNATKIEQHNNMHSK